MLDTITDIIAWGGAFGIFLLMVAENVFPPIPSEAIMSFAGVAAAQGKMNPALALAAGTLGAVAGNALWYEPCRRIGPERVERLADRHGRWFGVEGEDLRKGERMLRRHGALAVLVARCLPGVRTVISIPAGLARIPRPAFYGATLVGSALWSGLLMGAGWIMGGSEELERFMAPLGYAVIALSLGGYAWHLWRTRGRRRARRA